MDTERCTTLPKSLQPGSGVSGISWESVDDDIKDASAAMYVLSNTSTVCGCSSAESAHLK